jgi:hypothetical protein
LDSLLGIHENTGVSEEPGCKDGYGQKPSIPSGAQHDIGGKRRLGNIKLFISELAPENFLNFERQMIQPDSLGDDLAVGERQDTIVGWARKRKA